MKYEIVHLSDFHIKDKADFSSFVDKIIDSLIFEDENIDSKIILCITGDLTYSGKVKQFELFDSFLKLLSSKMRKLNKSLDFLFVPGNHDIELDSNICEERSNEIRTALDIGKAENLLPNEFEHMKNFFTFAKHYGLFQDNKFFCKKKYNFCGHEINFLLLNTSCFSSIKKNDKDMHYIPAKILNEIKIENINTITLMHHNFEWFDESCQSIVENICKSSIFYLFGHSHKTDIIQYEIGKGFLNSEIQIDNLQNSSYSIFLLDLNGNTLEQYKVEYDNIEHKFVRKNECKTKFDKILIDNKYIKNKYAEINSKIDINGTNYSLDDFFVMPLLTTNDKNKIINDFHNFIDYIKSKKIISINASFGRGKTTLIKKVFNYFIDDGKCVLFVYNQNLISNNYSQSIKNIFKDNYPNRNYDAFIQQKKESKVLIIDEFNIGKQKLVDFVNQSKDYFDIIIFTNDGTFDTRKEFLSENISIEFERINIEPYSLKQRRELTQKLVKYYKQEDKEEIICKCIDSIMTSETFIDMASPDNLIILIQRIILDKLYEERDMKDSFSIVFEHNIYNKLLVSAGDEKCDDAFTILREIAYFMFNKNKDECYKISTHEIVTLIETCKKEWGIKFEISKFLLLLDNSKLMKKKDENYFFIKNSYFAFFIAKGIIARKDNGYDVNNDLEKLIENISFGNYSDILLFIAYFNSSYLFFGKIMSILVDLTNNWQKLSYDTNNHYILKRSIKDGISIKENMENKIEFNKRIDYQERKFLKKADKEGNTNYSSNQINDDINNIFKAFKLLEILSKGLGGYKGKIRVSQRNEMLNTIVDNTYKLIFKIFDFSDDDYESVYQDITNTFQSKSGSISSKSIEKKITNILYDLMSTFTLNLLTTLSKIYISKNSIDLVNDLEDKDSDGNMIFNNVLVKLTSYERYGNEDKFINYLYETYDNLKSMDQKRMVRRIFYLFVITNNIAYQNLERICNKLSLSKEKIYLLNPNIKRMVSSISNLIKSNSI